MYNYTIGFICPICGNIEYIQVDCSIPTLDYNVATGLPCTLCEEIIYD